MVAVAASPAEISSQASASAVESGPAPPHCSDMATPYRPIAARPWSASRGNSFSLSQRAACGAILSSEKRRTASRICSCCGESVISIRAHVGDGVMAEERTAFRVALRYAVHAPPSEVQDPRRAVDVAAFCRIEERRIQLGGERVLFHAEPRLDRKPHRAIGRRHQRRAVDDAAGPLEERPVRQLNGAGLLVCAHDAKAVMADKARFVQHALKLGPCRAHRVPYRISSATAVASPPPMQRLATPRRKPYFRSAP